jgi:AmmeMemoRadiSam system protein B/AmmeMemoRadiSam system protein A
MNWLALLLTLVAGGCASCTKKSETHPGAAVPQKPAPSTKPAQARRIREAQMAGSWYSENQDQLTAEVDALYQEARPPKMDGKVIALISPHAGYRYSGKTAAANYQLLRGQDVRRVVLLAISHHYPLVGASIPDVTDFETPLGLIPVDSKAVARLRRCPVVSSVMRAEEGEHSLEIQLPLLQRALPKFSLVPILVGRMTDQDYVNLAAALAEVVDSHTVVVASSDFTHRGVNYGYEVPAGPGDVQARLARLDQGSIDQISKLSRTGLLSYADKTGTTICGLHPIALLLELLNRFPGSKPHVVSHTTSGDVTGDWSSSVTYVGMAFTGKWREESKLEEARTGGEEAFPLSAEDKRTLLRLARLSLEASVRKGRFDPEGIKPIAVTPSLERKAGAFVTLKCKSGPDATCSGHGGELRGCIGTIEPSSTVYDVVARRAASAALEDTRFPHSVTVEELPSITIEISVLTPPRPVKSADEIVIGRHGIILANGWNRATFLPQVAPEQGWDRETTLRHLAQKAGLPSDGWKKAEFEVYEAIVFSEDEK